MGSTVLIPEDITEAGKAFLRDRGYRIKMGTGFDEETIVREVVGCDAILARNCPITRKVLCAEPGLRVVGKHGVGLDKIDLDSAAELGVWVTNGPESNTIAVAELTILLIMACAKRLTLLDKACRAGDYGARNRCKGNDLAGKTLGLVGTGKIGGIVARKAAHGLDLRVIAYDPYLPAERRSPDIAYQDSLEAVFAQADFVSLHMPSTGETRGMVNGDLLRRMRPSAYLINAARGDVVVEADLVRALEEGVIAGAGLDVFDPEPPAADNPLFGMDNVVCLPHVAALTAESADRMGLHAAQGIVDVLEGRTPQWPCVAPGR